MENYETMNFSDSAVWSFILILGVLFGSLIVANIIKTRIPFLKKLLIPNAVLGGLVVLIISSICYYTSGYYLFNLPAFNAGMNGISVLEIITYHCLAIGFIALMFRPSQERGSKERTRDIINSGVQTIGCYMIQAIAGVIITIIASLFIKEIASGSGILMCFGYGQGTGQALNIGKNFDASLGTNYYASFGLTMAALGFLTASIAGVAYLNYLRAKGKVKTIENDQNQTVSIEDIQSKNEVPMTESVDKMSIQLALVLLAYVLAYGIMYVLGNLLLGPGSSLTGTIYGFNFMFGVLAAAIIKAVINLLKKSGLLKREYTNAFLLNRISGFAFDLMIVSGICAIQIDLIDEYWLVILLLGLAGAVVTYFYLRLTTKYVFPEYENEEFLAWFGMLTGTASTGMILLREADPKLETPVSENLVYQNFPAIILGFPLLLIANSLTTNAGNLSNTLMILGIVIVIFIVLNVYLFRAQIFKKRGKQ